MKRIEVVAAIIRHGDKIFATQRGYGEMKGGWEFPGGKIEPGETPEQALRREIMEELDTMVSVDRFVHTVEYGYTGFHLTMHCYLCSVIQGDLVLKEHKDARWLDSSTLSSVDWLPADIQLLPILENILKEIKD